MKGLFIEIDKAKSKANLLEFIYNNLPDGTITFAVLSDSGNYEIITPRTKATNIRSTFCINLLKITENLGY